MPCSSRQSAPGRIRLMGDSFAYASPGMLSHACRHALTLVLSVGDRPIELSWGPQRLRGTALLVPPLVNRTLHAWDTPFVLVDLEPNHASFRRIVLGAAAGGVQPLPALAAQPLQRVACAFHARLLGGPALDAELRAAVGVLAAAWPDPGPLDPRVALMMSTMDRLPSITLNRLAQTLGLSPTRASRLFSTQLGIPARAYSMSAKVRAAATWMGSGRSLTEVALRAGFADSAHFAKVWLRSYGASPSHYFPAQRTAMDADGLPNWAAWSPPRPDARPEA